MQTFLPLPDPYQSVLVLDNRRLGKQRVEARQIVNALVGDSGWKNHPAVLMWKGCIPALKAYHNICIEEWVRRGFKNSMELYDLPIPKEILAPAWFGNFDFHASHRSNLLRKDCVWYGQFGWKEPCDLPYFWPTKMGF